MPPEKNLIVTGLIALLLLTVVLMKRLVKCNFRIFEIVKGKCDPETEFLLDKVRKHYDVYFDVGYIVVLWKTTPSSMAASRFKYNT